jgi:hypothetical protein
VTNYPYILFNKSPLQLRLLGARGGRAYGRNQRARRARMPPPPPAVPLPAAPQETTAQAIAVLDAQFPWLHCAERRIKRGNNLPAAFPVAGLRLHSPRPVVRCR